MGLTETLSFSHRGDLGEFPMEESQTKLEPI